MPKKKPFTSWLDAATHCTTHGIDTQRIKRIDLRTYVIVVKPQTKRAEDYKVSA